MQKALGILGIATKVMTFIIVTVIAGVSLATSYIMFAPDDMPKPFRLQYSYGAPTQTGAIPTTAPTAAPTAIPLKPGEGIMFNMSTKIINLADPSGRKYIRLTVVLEFAPDDPTYKTTMKAADQTTYLTAFNAKVNALMPIMDDAVITMLSTKTYEELYTADGKEKLRQEVMQAIQARVPDYKLISIYFTEFVVQ